MREFAFELAMCSALEADSDGLLARQLGTHTRIVDVVEVSPGPAFGRRTEITSEAIPGPAIESDVGVGRARRPTEAIDATPERAAAIADRAIRIGFFETEHRGGRRFVRRASEYPEWIGGLRAFENKPDLARPGDLERQLRKDVSLSLFDEVVLVTESYVTGAHLHRIPDPVGVWRFDAEAGDFETVREPEPLAADEAGIAVLDGSPTAVEIEPVGAAEKARLRRRIAERAYGKGWRPDTMPGCEQASARGPPFGPSDVLPYCAWKGRFVDPARECGPDCAGHAPADPPAADTESVRDDRTPWVADPDGVRRKQVGLDRFGDT
ncbi:DUF5787 family protein [Natronomonas sp. LN261]|uniref:DUF5787 family protein n=1 Tax=Natronomonas sp. LN261 TaxID=2750669 RepID=UPI0015EF346D